MTKTSKNPAVAIVQARQDGTLPSGSDLRRGLGHDDFRAIKEVLDTRLPPGHRRRTAQSVLDPLSAVGLAELRTAVHAENAKGNSVFFCAQCEAPVFLAQQPAAPNVPRNGEAAYFKHFSDKDAPPCAWRTQNLHSVGGRQYDGMQEGLDHHGLKHALAECLRADPRFTDVQVERRITGDDGNWRVPDVSAVFSGRIVAFDLQLATLTISTILQRATFYCTNSIHHVVLTDAVDLGRLTRQAFCDLHLNAGGRIFAIDDASIAVSMRDHALALKELRIVPRIVADRPIHNVWKSRLVGLDTLLMDPRERRIEGERLYGQALLNATGDRLGPQRRAIRRAAAQNLSPASIFEHWNPVARAICAPPADDAIAQELGAVLVFLAQVEILARAALEQKAGAELELHRRLRSLLATRNAVHWAPLVVQVFNAVPAIEMAIGDANRARLNALLSQTHIVEPLLRRHAGMLSLLHPWLAFRLVVKAPKFLPSLRLPSSRA